jgi:hypothetical protein
VCVCGSGCGEEEAGQCEQEQRAEHEMLEQHEGQDISVGIL